MCTYFDFVRCGAAQLRGIFERKENTTVCARVNQRDRAREFIDLSACARKFN